MLEENETEGKQHGLCCTPFLSSTKMHPFPAKQQNNIVCDAQSKPFLLPPYPRIPSEKHAQHLKPVWFMRGSRVLL